MEVLLSKLAEHGIVGLVACLACYVAWVLLNRSMQAHQDDLTWCRGEILRQQQEFTTSLKDLAINHLKMVARLELRWEKTTDELVGRLELIERCLRDQGTGIPRRQDN